MSVAIIGVIRQKPVLTHANIVYGMLASVNSVSFRWDCGEEKKEIKNAI